MDINWNFNSLGTDAPGAMNRQLESTPLSQQGSIYSMTLDQIQDNLGRDCGQMNMEEFFKSICNTEETQGMVSTNGMGLQRQGSIALPRLLSQKTVDEVWKYVTEEGVHTNNYGGGTNTPHLQKQPTLGEVTLEEFLLRAGATGDSSNAGYIHDPNTSLNGEFQQRPMVSDVLNNGVPRSMNHGSNLHPSVNGSMPTYQPQQQQPQQNQLLPQQPYGYGYGYGQGIQTGFTSGQVSSNGIEGFMGIGNQSHQEKNMTIPSGGMSVGTCSPVTQFPVLDGIRMTNFGTSLAAPSPYICSGGSSVMGMMNNYGITVARRGIDKVQMRKIKNRESATRSRARKQAQVMELEAEVEKLKKENIDLLRKQAEMSKMQTKLVKGMVNLQGRSQTKLRRTKSDIQ
ncbi:unnamed protein product [Microthlaspi erraticum]|uniref:BZIP domain-containing protein n=1 Tax=Microthlaspi erraticum TaxID=1685480 RepID=A0A6D2JQI1_9BRAS|nr:unnamed protein product [Microthlaspi erraticum]